MIIDQVKNNPHNDFRIKPGFKAYHRIAKQIQDDIKEHKNVNFKPKLHNNHTNDTTKASEIVSKNLNLGKMKTKIVEKDLHPINMNSRAADKYQISNLIQEYMAESDIVKLSKPNGNIFGQSQCSCMKFPNHDPSQNNRSNPECLWSNLANIIDTCQQKEKSNTFFQIAGVLTKQIALKDFKSTGFNPGMQILHAEVKIMMLSSKLTEKMLQYFETMTINPLFESRFGIYTWLSQFKAYSLKDNPSWRTTLSWFFQALFMISMVTQNPKINPKAILTRDKQQNNLTIIIYHILTAVLNDTFINQDLTEMLGLDCRNLSKTELKSAGYTDYHEPSKGLKNLLIKDAILDFNQFKSIFKKLMRTNNAYSALICTMQSILDTSMGNAESKVTFMNLLEKAKDAHQFHFWLQSDLFAYSDLAKMLYFETERFRNHKKLKQFREDKNREACSDDEEININSLSTLNAIELASQLGALVCYNRSKRESKLGLYVLFKLLKVVSNSINAIFNKFGPKVAKTKPPSNNNWHPAPSHDARPSNDSSDRDDDDTGNDENRHFISNECCNYTKLSGLFSDAYKSINSYTWNYILIPVAKLSRKQSQFNFILTSLSEINGSSITNRWQNFEKHDTYSATTFNIKKQFLSVNDPMTDNQKSHIKKANAQDMASLFNHISRFDNDYENEGKIQVRSNTISEQKREQIKYQRRNAKLMMSVTSQRNSQLLQNLLKGEAVKSSKYSWDEDIDSDSDPSVNNDSQSEFNVCFPRKQRKEETKSNMQYSEAEEDNMEVESSYSKSAESTHKTIAEITENSKKIQLKEYFTQKSISFATENVHPENEDLSQYKSENNRWRDNFHINGIPDIRHLYSRISDNKPLYLDEYPRTKQADVFKLANLETLVDWNKIDYKFNWLGNNWDPKHRFEIGHQLPNDFSILDQLIIPDEDFQQNFEANIDDTNTDIYYSIFDTRIKLQDGLDDSLFAQPLKWPKNQEFFHTSKITSEMKNYLRPGPIADTQKNWKWALWQHSISQKPHPKSYISINRLLSKEALDFDTELILKAVNSLFKNNNLSKSKVALYDGMVTNNLCYNNRLLIKIDPLLLDLISVKSTTTPTSLAYSSKKAMEKAQNMLKTHLDSEIIDTEVGRKMFEEEQNTLSRLHSTAVHKNRKWVHSLDDLGKNDRSYSPSFIQTTELIPNISSFNPDLIKLR